MKKQMSVLLTIVLLTISLIGCGNSTANDNLQEEEKPITEQETTEVSETEISETEAPETQTPETQTPETETTDNSASYYGTWEVKDYQSASVSALSSDDMESFRGSKVTYEADAILLNGEETAADNFTYEADSNTYNYDSLTEAYQANLGEWWNNINEVTYVAVNSNDIFFGSQFFVADSDTLWIYYEGVFFLAKRVE